MIRRWSLGVVCLVLAAVVAGGSNGRAVQAQGGLTDAQLALLDRVFTARKNLETYPSYIETVTGSQRRQITVGIGARAQSSSFSITWDRTATIIREGDEKNVAGVFNAAVEERGTGPGGRDRLTTRSITMEIRRVGGQLYVNARYDSGATPGAGAPALPDGWVVVESVDQWPALQDLYLDDFLDAVSPFDNPDLIKAAAADVTAEPAALADGTPADTITITFDREGIQMVMGAGGMIPAAVLAAAGETSVWTVTVLIDVNDFVYEVTSDLSLKAVGVDASVLGNRVPAVGRVDFTLEFLRTDVYSEIGVTFEPAVVPEGVTP